MPDIGLIYVAIVQMIFHCHRYHRSRPVAIDDHSATTRLISDAEPTTISYMEFDEVDERFKITSGSYEREHDL